MDRQKLKIIRYQSKSGKGSGVVAYAVGQDYIVVWYESKKPGVMTRYTYTYQSAGEVKVEKMIAKAGKQQGLSTYVSQNQPGYAEKLDVPALKDKDFS